MDYSMGITLGDQIGKGKVTFGYNAALSYKSYSEYYKDAEYGRYGMVGDPSVYELELREFQKGDYGVTGVLWSGMAGVAIKTLGSKYRINFLHLQNGESRAGIFDYIGADQGSNFEGFQHNLDYSERALTNLLISGKHNFTASKWEIEWKFAPTWSKMEEPDTRFVRYVYRENKVTIGTESGFPERIWRYLEEVNYAGLVHINKEFEFNGQKAKVQFGGAYTYKERDFSILSYAINVRDIPLTGDPNELFRPENLWPYEGNLNKGTTYEASFIPVNPNMFNSNTNNTGVYAAIDLNPLKSLKTIVGVRFENYTQRYTGQDQLGTKVLNDDKVLDELDIFPSLNLIYYMNDKQNLRCSFAKTIARPSFKELSYAEIYDPISTKTYVGGLFRDADDVAGVEYWDGNLVSTTIFNYDLRWELFMPEGQNFSVGAFYKKFDKPIEMVQYFVQTGSYQPRNVGDAEVFGAEIEFRLNMEKAVSSFNHLMLVSNVTITRSRVKLSKTEFDSRVENARTGQTIDEYRDMAGQSPYIINAGLQYEGGEHGFWKGFETGVYYNVQGITLQYVGIADRPDIYINPFHSLNFNANKTLGETRKWQVGLKVENLLGQEKTSVLQSYEANDQYFTRLDPGTQFTFRVSYNLF